jgi:hypothetical protein
VRRQAQRDARLFGYRFGRASGYGRARPLIPEPGEQHAIADTVAMRQGG